jgi:hypothetical protein
MGWIRVSDDFYDNDKFSEVGPLGVALHFAAIGFCNRNLTDGFFKKNKARLFLDFDGIGITTSQSDCFGVGVDGDDAVKLVIEWMMASELWHECGHGCEECHSREDGGEPGGDEYLIHDYLKFQFSRQEIEEKAEKARARKEAWKARQAAERSSEQRSERGKNGVRNAAGTLTEHDNPTPTPTPTKDSFFVPQNESLGGSPKPGTSPEPESTSAPRCARHPYGNPEDKNCRGCKRVKDAEKAQELQAEITEKAARTAAAERRRNCKLCGGSGWIDLPDDSGVIDCECKTPIPNLQLVHDATNQRRSAS